VSRRLHARLDRIAQAVTPPTDGPVCRFHGQHCQMGRNWPLPYPGCVEDDLYDFFIGMGVRDEPHPRDVWMTDLHEQVPPAELAAEKEELARLIAEAEARVAAEEAALKAGRP
jgi:hypothetical protein